MTSSARALTRTHYLIDFFPLSLVRANDALVLRTGSGMHTNDVL